LQGKFIWVLSNWRFLCGTFCLYSENATPHKRIRIRYEQQKAQNARNMQRRWHQFLVVSKGLNLTVLRASTERGIHIIAFLYLRVTSNHYGGQRAADRAPREEHAGSNCQRCVLPNPTVQLASRGHQQQRVKRHFSENTNNGSDNST
jgi:hypothetical protein